MYDVPGFSDNVNEDIKNAWNEAVKSNYNSSDSNPDPKYFPLDPNDIRESSDAKVFWFADPQEPQHCFDERIAQQLSDFGIEGRKLLHNEYCEYTIVKRQDSSGKLRPKRVNVTTEFKAYWECVARRDPNLLRKILKEILGIQPSWQDLYGVDDPFVLTEQMRAAKFSRLDKINTDNALFMSHPINGLSDLIYIVGFGSKPYAVKRNGQIEKASREEIFTAKRVRSLACRHADPAASMAAYGAVFGGNQVAFKNPLGMYIQSFNTDALSFQGEPLPEKWIRRSRANFSSEGQNEWCQRLVIGPSDEEPYFLDDIKIETGEFKEPVVGGFQILKSIEVGPLITTGNPKSLLSSDYLILDITGINTAIKCNKAEVCSEIQQLKEQYEKSKLHTSP